MINFEKLIGYKPTEIARFENSIGQEVVFLEHPTKGEDSDIICMFPYYKVAYYSGFYDIEDMTAPHGEYEPKYIDNLFFIGDFKH